ncbi:MerR family transcriptional regulator (plasmid) [Alicyclobacillus fastidiosus]|uniref:MerR family transcriptional regulator n=1 Tax=Alicyclobacillus fastidiosus TaxID=392011 RepID=A0ABY6ZRT2_9BACL|nr:MerR family transcriptional regulator [Alicyclobacillus fastidiosus]WAH44831.1 MerR family transcriptional regulator [Alicyclobacillus fastidiosus]GMA65796.1 hypothetical protein GCM10025859_62360 [Alicyclobacillus fastidiosus]GMA65868.1 hypothetical protein GCM10025859_63090 [Alicyclobacillus fastidiosus]
MYDDATRYVARFGTKAAASLAGISEPTVRKYSQHLSKHGYNISTANGRDRKYSDYDITVLTEMKRLSDETGMDVGKIAQMVIAKYGSAPVEDDSIQTESSEETALTTTPQDFAAVVELASKTYWDKAKQEMTDEISERVRDEVKAEFQSELGHLKDELRGMMEEVAATREKKKHWWRFGR